MTKKQKIALFISASSLLAILGVVFANANADDKAAKNAETPAVVATENAAPSKVLAKVNGKEITSADVDAVIAQMDPQIKNSPREMIEPMLVDQLIDIALINEKVATANLENDADVQKILAKAKQQVLQEVYLSKAVEAKITTEMLKKEYSKYASAYAKEKGEEIKASHILVDSEDKAKEIIKKLEAGEDFAALAKEKSSCPSSARGGDLGYFSKKDMVPAFSDAAYKLKVGEYTKVPVKTEFGWHVVKLTDRRAAKAPSFDEIKDQLKNSVAKDVIRSIVEDLHKTAKIEKFYDEAKPSADAKK